MGWETGEFFVCLLVEVLTGIREQFTAGWLEEAQQRCGEFAKRKNYADPVAGA